MVTRQAWDYLAEPRPDGARLAELGEQGWELVSAVTDTDGPMLYFKRPKLDLRERVTLDHRRAYEAAAGESASEAED